VGCRALDLLAVLVGSGEEERVISQQPVAACEDVGHDGGVRVADVRAGVDVVDRCGEIVGFLLVWHLWLKCQFTGYGRSRE
jgi:hypothetical protein